MPANGEDDQAALRHGDGVAQESEAAERPATETSNSQSKSIDELDLQNFDKLKKRSGPPPGWWAWLRGVVLTVRDVDVLSAKREATRNTCTFLVGLVACWLAVTVVAVVHSGFEYTPLFFLSIAEYDAGQIDVRVSAGAWTRHRFLNFSKFMAEIGEEEEYLSYAAPRIELPASLWPSKACEGKLNVSDVRERYEGPTPGEPCAGAAHVPSEGCLSRFCGPSSSAWLVLHDHALEERMGLGRHWPHGPVKGGEIMISRELAERLGVAPGDPLTLLLDLQHLVRAAVSAQTILEMDAATSALLSSFYVPLTVAAVLNSTHGRLDEEETAGAFVDLSSFIASLPLHANPQAGAIAADLEGVSAFDFAETINFNLPQPRLQSYMSNDFQEVKGAVLVFASRVVAALGPENVRAEVLLLGALQQLRVLSLFLALITSVIMSGLSGLLCLLIYSLLIVSVETRTFDLGVLRMVGLKRTGVVRLLLVQCLCYSLPAWGLGLVAGECLTGWGLRELGGLVGAVIHPHLQPLSILYASSMGLLVPLLSAVLPIRKALSATLSDALDVNRNRVQGVSVSIERAGANALPLGLLAAGSVSAGLGTVVYYLFPRALLEFNLTLLLYIFFGLLVAMIAGLTILALNLERPVEHVLGWTLLWWNPKAVRAVMHKNLTAHRLRNRKTSIMYALSLAFIIFVIKTFDLQVATFGVQEQQRLGAPFRLSCDRKDTSHYLLRAVDKFLETEAALSSASSPPAEQVVTDYALLTHSLADVQGAPTVVSTLGGVYEDRMHVIGASPNYMEVVLPGLSSLRQRLPHTTALQVTEELYTPHGSQSLVVGSVYRDRLGLHLNRSCLLHMRGDGGEEVKELAPLAFADAIAGSLFSPYPGAGTQDTLVSLPSYVRLSGSAVKSVADLPVHHLLFQVREGASEEALEQASNRLNRLADNVGCNLESIWDRTKGLKVAVSAMDFFGAGTTGVALLISFFSLVSSMVTNINEQGKEMGLLRALGVTKGWLRRIYTLEAVVLVLSAGSLGVAIGSLLAYTISAQRALITQLPLPFSLPVVPAGVLVLTSIVSAFFAAYLPAMTLARTNIVKLMRKP